MDVKAIKTNEDYEAALHRIDALMEAELNTPEGDELEVLSTLVDVYENEHFPIGEPDPVEFLKNAMEFRGENQSSLAKVLNSRSRANEIINKRRALTLTHIRKIVKAWNIPADPLIREYSLIRPATSRAALGVKNAAKDYSKNAAG